MNILANQRHLQNGARDHLVVLLALEPPLDAEVELARDRRGNGLKAV
jgi:hypothetical protein